MAKHSASLFELARKGATLRYHEMKAGTGSLEKVFTHLHFGSAVSPAMPDAVEASVTPRRRARMSVAQQKVIGVRTKTHPTARRVKM